MKTIFTLFASLLLTFSAFAYDQNRLSVSTVKDHDLRIEIDGKRYDLKDNTITIRDLRSGYHTVKVYREMKRKNNHRNDRNRNNNRQELIYNNSVYLKDGYHFDITLNRFGKALVDERRIDRDDDDWSDGAYDNDGGWNNGSGRAMSARDFIQAKESIGRTVFEGSKLIQAKAIVDRNWLSSQQVRQFIQLFGFENNRLELAKYAYGKTVDKRSYNVVSDALSHRSSKDELAKYIRQFN